MLEVDVRKRLRHFTIEIRLSCGPGELLALVGPSGAGKTTLLRMLAGLERPDAGTIRVGGETWADTAADFFLPPQKRQLGYVFQEYALFPHLTVEKNVAFAARDREIVAELLQRFGLVHLKNRKPHQISGGERQRAALAQALARGPQILLLDEPFSALDVKTRTRLRAMLKTIKSEWRLPVVHVTHDLEEAAFLADHVLPVAQGRAAPDWLAAPEEEVEANSPLWPPAGPAGAPRKLAIWPPWLVAKRIRT